MMIIISLIFAGYMAFLSVTSLLFVVEFGLSKSIFPLFQAAILVTWLIAGILFNKGFYRLGSFRIKATAISLLFLSALVLGAVSIIAPKNPYLLTLTMCLFAFGANWVMTLYFAEGMEGLPDIRATSSSLLTSFRLLTTALIIDLVGYYYDKTVLPLTILILSITFFSIPMLLFYEWKRSKVEKLDPVDEKELDYIDELSKN